MHNTNATTVDLVYISFISGYNIYLLTQLIRRQERKTKVLGSRKTVSCIYAMTLLKTYKGGVLSMCDVGNNFYYHLYYCKNYL